MRHQHAGLAIPDFPLAYGKAWPPTDPASVALYNQRRIEIVSMNPITSFQIVLQMAHRLTALLIAGAVGFAAWATRRRFGAGHSLSRLALFWLGLVLAQALLGAATIWSNKAADVATLHVLAGALSLLTGSLLCRAAWPLTAKSPVSEGLEARRDCADSLGSVGVPVPAPSTQAVFTPLITRTMN
jgi:cytochrome c oxidase assembly protein subunit 15